MDAQVVIEFIKDVVFHIFGTTDGVALVAIVAAGIMKAVGQRNKEIEDKALAAFNTTEKVLEVVDTGNSWEVKAEHFLKEFRVAWQDDHKVSPSKRTIRKAKAHAAKLSHERKAAKVVKTLASLAKIMGKK